MDDLGGLLITIKLQEPRGWAPGTLEAEKGTCLLRTCSASQSWTGGKETKEW